MKAKLPAASPQIRVLSKVVAEPGITITELWSAVRGIKPESIAGYIAHLRLEGYITPGLKRGPFTPTDRGIKALREARDTRELVYAQG